MSAVETLEEHAEREWPGEGLQQGLRAVFLARGGHAPGAVCALEPGADLCRESVRLDGKHSWRFDGDDPYIICSACDAMRDAITGRVVRA